MAIRCSLRSRGRQSTPVVLFSVILTAMALSAFSGILQGNREQDVLPEVEYKIGANDLLEIRVFEQPELTQTVRVSEEGSISFPLIDKVQVSGLTVRELERRIATLLEEKWLKTAHVSVFIREYQRASIMGGVRTPGRYELIGQVKLLHLISQAGGLTDLALKDIQIYREGPNGEKVRIDIDLEDLIQGGNQDLNITVQPKDQIIVPTDQIISVYVYGEVNSPGVFQFRMSKRPTLMQAIAQAGGTTAWAKRSSVVITRKDRKTGRENQIRVNLKNIMNGKVSDPLLEEGDVIIVP